MKKHLLFAVVVLVLLTACMTVSLGSPTAVPPAPADTPVIVPPAPIIADTPIPTTIPLPTETAIPTTPPTVTPTLVILPQQWNGVYRQAGVGSIPISIIIEKMKGNTFTGKMIWTGKGNIRGATTIIEGEFVTDFGDAVEQAKWGKHPDYTGVLEGPWIKWTETGFVQGRGYTLGGWYYGHIREDGSMAGIYFLNDEITSFSSSDFWELETR
jgi:hypothetical protein